MAYHTLPVRHGMTVGELARMFAAERKLDVKLTVIPIDGWRRTDYWHDTGLAWINPSPNMRSETAAVLYPGIGLLETTNVSVGRGTDSPFEVMGAPWIDERELAERVNRANPPGVRVVPIRFTPTSSKFAGESCGGLNFVITDWDAFRSFELGLIVAHALRVAASRRVGSEALHAAARRTSRFIARLLAGEDVAVDFEVGRRTGARVPRSPRALSCCIPDMMQSQVTALILRSTRLCALAPLRDAFGLRAVPGRGACTGT